MRTPGSPGFVSRSKITASASLASTKTPRTEISVVWSGSDAGERQHGMHQDIGARRAIHLGRVLKLIVELIHDRGVGAAAIHRKRDFTGNDITRGIGDDGLADSADRLGTALPC